jgi:Domain of unknown function (DUF4328)
MVALPDRRLRTALRVLLVADAVAAWLVVVGVYTFLERVWRGLGDRFLASPIETHLAQLQALRRLQGIAWVVTAAAFLLWLHRAFRQLSAMGVPGLQFDARSAVKGFLVPLANVVLPLRAMAELWRASDPDWVPDDSTRRAAPPAPLLWWWVLLLVGTLADPPWGALFGSVEEITIGGTTLRLVAGQVAYIGAAALALYVVRAIDRRRDARRESAGWS